MRDGNSADNERLRADLAAIVEVATVRWRALPADSHEKQVLRNARASLAMCEAHCQSYPRPQAPGAAQMTEPEQIADRFFYAPTLSKLYLELANVVPPDCVSSRELALKKRADKLQLVLLMIAEGCADPRGFARETLAKLEPPK